MNILVQYLNRERPIAKKGFKPQAFTKRSTGTNEVEQVGRNAFQRLLQAIRNRYGDPHYTSNSLPIIVNTSKYLYGGSYGFGDNEDTVYINTDKQISIAHSHHFAVVCGADHLTLGYAMYTNIGVFQTNGLAFGIVTDAMKMNSASCYAPSLPNVGKSYCIEIRSDYGSYPHCSEPLSKEIKNVLIQNRVNLNPHSKTGPDVDEIISPMVLGYRGNNKKPPPSRADGYRAVGAPLLFGLPLILLTLAFPEHWM